MHLTPLLPYLPTLLRAFYLLSALLVLTVNSIPHLRSTLIPYGKTLPQQRTRPLLHVPKSYFSHFYILGFPWAAFVLLTYIYALNAFPTLASPTTEQSLTTTTTTLISLVLITLHTLRRLHESLTLFRSSNAKIHVFHYLFGLIYYFITPIALSIEGWQNILTHGKHPSMHSPIPCKATPTQEKSSPPYNGTLLFIYASHSQHTCHKILASLRSSSSSSQPYTLPKTSHFTHTSCPHYFFECLIYASFIIIQYHNPLTACTILI
ncbi:Steroid 5 alpha-reductase 3 [Rhizophlyctis rosea]|nr:Steroid 5 alpha-reductase 3 [Rhizophlyctis rosea]